MFGLIKHLIGSIRYIFQLNFPEIIFDGHSRLTSKVAYADTKHNIA